MTSGEHEVKDKFENPDIYLSRRRKAILKVLLLIFLIYELTKKALIGSTRLLSNTRTIKGPS